MTRAETIRCWIFGLFALGALIGTQWALVDFLSDSGSMSDILDASVDGPVATFFTIDLLSVALVATIFMIVEGNRIKLPYVWVYVLLVFAVAVSVSFPLFLIARTRQLAAQRTREANPAQV